MQNPFRGFDILFTLLPWVALRKLDFALVDAFGVEIPDTLAATNRTQISVQHTIQYELKGVIAFVAAIWAVFLFDWVLPVDLNSFGLIPRSLPRLTGIPAMPFLHANWEHIVGNTLPLFILLVLLAGSRANSWTVVVAVVLLGGALLWVLGRPAIHIGASGLIFGLFAFLIVAGFLEGRFIPLLIALGVAFFYGGTLFSGIIPRLHSHVSWDGHLCGALAGGIIAYLLTRVPQPRKESTPLLPGL